MVALRARLCAETQEATYVPRLAKRTTWRAQRVPTYMLVAAENLPERQTDAAPDTDRPATALSRQSHFRFGFFTFFFPFDPAADDDDAKPLSAAAAFGGARGVRAVAGDAAAAAAAATAAGSGGT